MDNHRIVGITSSEYVSKIFDLLPANEGRQSLIYWLIRSYRIDEQCNEIIPIKRSEGTELKKFHDSGFVDALLQRREYLDSDIDNYKELIVGRKIRYFKDVNRLNMDDSEDEEDEVEEDSGNENLDIVESSSDSYGLSYDCYVFPFMADYVQLVAGSTISTAEFIIRTHRRHRNGDKQIIGINWYGGRHHSHKNKASGFCYVNDIVLGINTLRLSFPKVFYLDLDLHHGDGVESAFKFSSKVVTCSIHRHDIGFFPGTGSDSVKDRLINIPTRKGLSDGSLQWILTNIVIPCIRSHNPSILVLQLGSDGLALDEHKQWNLTIKGFTKCVEELLLTIKCPAMVLGGGGYNHTETAKFCAYLTKRVIGMDKAEDMIPEHPLLDIYQDDGFRFWTSNNLSPSKMKDENNKSYLEEIKEKVLTQYI